MPRKKYPDGYVARCQCGAILGCMELNGTLNIPGLATLNGPRAALDR